MADQRTHQQQPNDPQRPAPGQQNREGDRQRTQPPGSGQGVSGGVDTGAIEPGRTQDGGNLNS